MAVHIRLARHGTKKAPFYRVVVTDQRNPRDGRFIDSIGTFNPLVDKLGLNIDRERLSHWQQRGAQLSHTLQRLLKKHAASESSSA